MPKEAGYGVIFSPDGVIEEHKYHQCCHCNNQFRVDKGVPVDQLGGFCRICYQPHCSKPKCQVCTPFEKWLDEQEKRAYIKGQYDIMLRF